jgi:hypothetical protein
VRGHADDSATQHEQIIPRSRGGGSPICWQNCWQKPPLNLQADEIPRRPMGLRRNDKQRRGCEDTRMIRPLNTNKSSPRSRGGGSPICWQNCWQKQSLKLQADEIPPRPMGLRRNDKRWRGCEDTRMIRPLNTNKSSPRSRGGGSPICWQNCWQKQSVKLQTDEIPRRPKGSVGMTSRGEGCAGREPDFVGRIVGRTVGRNNPSNYKRMRFLVRTTAPPAPSHQGRHQRPHKHMGT